MSKLLFESNNSITADLMSVFKKYSTKNGYLRSGNPLADFNSEIALAIDEALNNSFTDGYIDGIDTVLMYGEDFGKTQRKTSMETLTKSRGVQL